MCQGESRDGVYTIQLPSSPSLSIKPQANVALATWYQRIGHVNLRTVCQVISENSLFVSNAKDVSLCYGCSVGKTHELPFSMSSFVAKHPLELICSDIC